MRSGWDTMGEMARLLLLFGLVMGGAVLIGYPWQPVAAAIKPPAEGQSAPDFRLHDESGVELRLTDYRGKALVLNFWATWCEPCKLEIPWFIEFENKYQNEGFAVLGVSMDEDGWKAVKPYVAKMRINYRVLLGNEATARLYGGVASVPTTLLIDRTGKIAAIHTGFVSKSAYQGEIEALLRR